jgi:chloramphenicol-sensitive protein RarD
MDLEKKHIDRQQGTGALVALGAYILWGFMPLYWKLMEDIPAMDILCYRVAWALLFVAVAVFAMRGWRRVFIAELKVLVRDRLQVFYVLGCAVLITINWFIYIWTVISDHTADASLGYFINPLLNFVLAILFLGEKLKKSGLFACGSALAGVVVITVQAGALPTASLYLAVSFALYGFLKKKVQMQAYTSLMLETLLITPFAIVWLLGFSSVGITGLTTAQHLLAFGCGFLTLLPLLLFAEAARRLSYIAIGFIQYISPTINFVLAIFVFHEELAPLRLAGFALIWLGVVVYTVGTAGRAGRSRREIDK